MTYRKDPQIETNDHIRRQLGTLGFIQTGQPTYSGGYKVTRWVRGTGTTPARPYEEVFLCEHNTQPPYVENVMRQTININEIPPLNPITTPNP
jgi:hypothetical protein